MVENALTVSNPPATKPPVTASFFPKGGLVPDSFESLWRLSDVFAASSMVPKQMIGKPADVFVAIQMGLELNLSPMQALQNIAVINGRPSLWGDAVIALVRASGKLDEFDEFFEGQPYQDNYQAVCVLKRQGDKKLIRREFSVADAKLAKLWGKEGPWCQYPKRMLQMRARSWALRDGFGDVLRGVRTAEEQMDEPPAIEMRPVPAPVAQPEIEVVYEPRIDMESAWQALFANWPTLPATLHDSLRMFTTQTAEANGCTAADVIEGALKPENSNGFIEAFHAWRGAVKEEPKPEPRAHKSRPKPEPKEPPKSEPEPEQQPSLIDEDEARLIGISEALEAANPETWAKMGANHKQRLTRMFDKKLAGQHSHQDVMHDVWEIGPEGLERWLTTEGF